MLMSLCERSEVGGNKGIIKLSVSGRVIILYRATTVQRAKYVKNWARKNPFSNFILNFISVINDKITGCQKVQNEGQKKSVFYEVIN
jgi:hypothetical protein